MERIKRALERAKQEQQKKNVLHFDTGARPKTNTKHIEVKYTDTQVYDISNHDLRRNRIVLGDENDEPTAAFKILRTQVLQRMTAKNWNTLAVTSPEPDEGKTSVAINLAIAIAREVHRTVLLVDLDLRNPNIHRYFNYEPKSGINDYLLDDKPLSNILFNPGIERLVVLPGNHAIHHSSEMLSSPKMAQLVADLKTRYPSRFVIYDLPPVLLGDDALAFSPHVDTMLVVAEDGKTGKGELKQTFELLKGINILGTVLNKTKAKVSTYY